jgi:hypothetical protein
VARQQAERPVDLVELRLDQAEAVGRGTVDRGEVGVVGLGARVGRQAILPGGQRVDDPRFKIV